MGRRFPVFSHHSIIPTLHYSNSLSSHRNDMPPSTLIVWPVMKSLSGEARNNMAPTTSCGIWMRLNARSADGRFAELDHLFRRIFFRQRVAGSETIDVDIVIADFARQRAGKTYGCRFRCHVVNSSRRAGKHGARSDGDDLAGFLLAHGRQHGAAAEKQAAQIYRHEPVPFFGVDGFDPSAVHRHDGENRGVVDQNVDTAEALERSRGHLLGRIFV